MSHFIGKVVGGRGEASRLGTKTSGISGEVSGWNCGIQINGYVDEDGADRFDVFITGGSNNSGKCRMIGSFTAENLEDVGE